MKLGYRIISLVLALLLLGGVLTGCAAVVKPLNYFKRVLEKTIDRRFGGETVDVLLETLAGGSIEVDFGGTDLFETPLQAARAKLWFDQEQQSVAAVGSLTVGDTNYDGKLFLTSEELVLSSVAFFGSTDFGVNFKTLSKDLENSIFRNNSGTAFARTEIGENTAKDVLELRDSFFTLYDSIEDVLELSDEVAEDFLAILTDYAPHSRYSEDGRLYISATVDNAVLSRTLRETRARVVKDRSICRELRELAATRDAVLSVKQGTVVTEWSDKVESFIASPLSIEELCTKIDALPLFTLQLDASVRRLTGLIETATVSFEQAGEKLFDFTMDLTEKKTNYLELTYGGYVRSLTYTVHKNGLRYYSSELLYEKESADGEIEVNVTGFLDADKNEDQFTLSLIKGEETRVFEGSFDKKIDGFEVSVDSVKIDDSAHRFSLFCAIKTEAEAEEMPEYVNLVTVPEARFEPIAARMQGARDSLVSAWGETKPSIREMLAFFLTVVGVEEEIPSETDDQGEE